MGITRKKRQKLCFSTGCVMLTCAIMCLTLIPLIINNFMPRIFVAPKSYKLYAVAFYALTLAAFLFSSKYLKFQIRWTTITLVYYIAFQAIAKIFL